MCASPRRRRRRLQRHRRRCRRCANPIGIQAEPTHISAPAPAPARSTTKSILSVCAASALWCAPPHSRRGFFRNVLCAMCSRQQRIVCALCVRLCCTSAAAAAPSSSSSSSHARKQEARIEHRVYVYDADVDDGAGALTMTRLQ